MADDKRILERAKTYLTQIKQKAEPVAKKIFDSPIVQKVVSFLKWNNLRPYVLQARDVIVSFTKQQPKTAAFIYVCLFCSFSIAFIDKPLALSRLKEGHSAFWSFFVTINPAGWWFLILIVLWLFYMATAGLSLTTEVFEKNLIKARAVLQILWALAISSLFTLFLNILFGRYSPEFLDSMHLYGFSALRFRASEISFPCFAAQSIWVVAMAAGFHFQKIKRYFYIFAGACTFALVMTAECFLSDAVMGTYIGIIMYYATAWIISENRENFPLISL